MSMTIKVTTTGQSRSGIAAKSQKPYTMAVAYAHLPNVPFPQEFSYYCAAQNEVLPAGEYECEVVLSIKDGRIGVEVDPRQGRRLTASAPAARAAS